MLKSFDQGAGDGLHMNSCTIKIIPEYYYLPDISFGSSWYFNIFFEQKRNFYINKAAAELRV